MDSISNNTQTMDFEKLEEKLNEILKINYSSLLNSEEKIQYYASLFDRTKEDGFYFANPGRGKGEGEIPDWQPNPAYMESLEMLWTGTEVVLNDFRLRLEKTLRDLFFESREYRDYKDIHRRVFLGQFINEENKKPVTLFVLTIPHSHKCFELNEAPVIYISKFIKKDSVIPT